MNFLWWNKPLDVHCLIHNYLLNKSNQLSEYNLPSNPYDPREDDEPYVDHFGEF